MDYTKLFCDVLPAWLSGMAAVVAIIISCKSNSKSNKLQAKIADDNSILLKDIQRRDANMKLYDLRLGVYTAFMRALDVEQRIKEAQQKLPITQIQATTELLNELTECKLQIEKNVNIASFCFAHDSEILQAINNAKEPFFVFCDEILNNMQNSKNIALVTAEKMIAEKPGNARQILSDMINCNTDSQFYHTHQQAIAELGHKADQAFEEYKILVSYEKFGKLFEKYLSPEAIML